MKSIKAILVIITLLTGSLGILVSDVNSESSKSDRQAVSSTVDMQTEKLASEEKAVTPTSTPLPTATSTPVPTATPEEAEFIISTEVAVLADETVPGDSSEIISVDGEEIVIPEAIHLDKNSAENAVMGGTELAGEEVDIEETIRRFTEESEEEEEEQEEYETERPSDSGSGSSSSGSGSYKTVERFGVDVSDWNDEIDWNAMARAGVQFAFIRAGGRGWTGGQIYYDDYFVQNVRGAAAAGIDVGVYFYSTAINVSEAKEEAAWVISEINKNNLGKYINYPIAFDMEEIYGNGRRHSDMSTSQYNKIARAFLDVVKQNGYTPCLYASASYFGYVWDMDLYDDCVIWLAQYNDYVDYDVDYDIWQYTARGKVNGNGTTYCDLNIEYKKVYVESTATPTAVPTQTKQATATATPSPKPTTTPVPELTVVSEDCLVTGGNPNVRSAPDSDGNNIIAMLEEGATIHRTGIAGLWSEIEYEGQKGYVLSEYLEVITTPEEPEAETEENPVF